MNLEESLFGRAKEKEKEGGVRGESSGRILGGGPTNDRPLLQLGGLSVNWYGVGELSHDPAGEASYGVSELSWGGQPCRHVVV